MTIAANQTRLSLPQLPSEVQSIDVCFDGQRVWSFNPHHFGPTAEWPPALAERLNGSTRLSILDSRTRKVLFATDISFSDAPHRTSVVGTDGEPLAINKWGRLGRTIGGSGLHDRILDRAEELIDALQEMGKRPFLVGGTLLGGVREGELLPFDDDADIAYLSEYSSPVDVGIESFRIGRMLERLGYTIVRHSAAHLQVTFYKDNGDADYYIDIFSAFFSNDGHINQPFHVRGKMREDQILPFGVVEIRGRAFPAPADPESWLAMNYDDKWRTPQPGFQLNTPRSTARRFTAWFGSFNNGRDFWNDYYASADPDASADTKWTASAAWILSQRGQLASSQILELGAGEARICAQLASGRHRRVIAVDFSPAAMARARRLADEFGYEIIHANLRRLLSISLPSYLGFEGSFDVVGNHIYEQISPDAREPLLRLSRMALNSGGTALFTIQGKRSRGPEEDITSWHLTRRELALEARRYGMGCEFFAITNPSCNDPYGVRLQLAPTRLPRKDLNMRSYIKQLIQKFRGARRVDVSALQERVIELEAELDEYRKDHQRIAQLTDLIESRLSPQSKI